MINRNSQIVILALLVALLVFAPTAMTQVPGCNLRFEGSDRAPVKNRRLRQPDYTFVNGGRAISVPSGSR